jgi:hypothetical protein
MIVPALNAPSRPILPALARRMTMLALAAAALVALLLAIRWPPREAPPAERPTFARRMEARSAIVVSTPPPRATRLRAKACLTPCCAS